MGFPGKPVWEKTEKTEGLGTPDWRKRPKGRRRAHRKDRVGDDDARALARFAGRARKRMEEG